MGVVIDYKLLIKQKEMLVEMAISKKRFPDVHKNSETIDALDGIIGLLDAIQDESEEGLGSITIGFQQFED